MKGATGYRVQDEGINLESLPVSWRLWVGSSCCCCCFCCCYYCYCCRLPTHLISSHFPTYVPTYAPMDGLPPTSLSECPVPMTGPSS